MKPGTVILSTVRTPFGRLGGALSSLAATSLGADAIRAGAPRFGFKAERKVVPMDGA